MSRDSWSVGGLQGGGRILSRFDSNRKRYGTLERVRMEGLRMGQAPEDRQSGALMEGFEWSRLSAAEGFRLVVVKSDSHSIRSHLVEFCGHRDRSVSVISRSTLL